MDVLPEVPSIEYASFKLPAAPSENLRIFEEPAVEQYSSFYRLRLEGS